MPTVVPWRSPGPTGGNFSYGALARRPHRVWIYCGHCVPPWEVAAISFNQLPWLRFHNYPTEAGFRCPACRRSPRYCEFGRLTCAGLQLPAFAWPPHYLAMIPRSALAFANPLCVMTACTTVEDGVARDGKSRSIAITLNFPKDGEHGLEGLQREAEGMAVTRMRAVCANAHQGEPVEIRRTWWAINSLAINFECRPPASASAS